MTANTLTFRGRLPGVDCNPALPAVDQPVRLDVAGFVGFAERGPIDVAVPIEDMTQYAVVFGGDLPLAQDHGVPVYANLPTAVRTFFDNGGRRCYVVRVLGTAATAGRFAVPGLQVWTPTGATSPAAVAAAWEGSWSRGVSVDTMLSRTLLRPKGTYTRRSAGTDGVLPLSQGESLGVQAGDLVRLNLAPPRPDVFLRVASVDNGTSTLSIDTEIPFTINPAGAPEPAPSLLASLPAVVPNVLGVELLRFDLVVRQHTAVDSRILDRRTDLAFGGGQPAPGRPSWTQVIQDLDARQPDLDRSLVLRQDAATMAALVGGLAIPVAMPTPDAPLDPAAPTPAALVDGKDDLGTFDAARMYDASLVADSIYSLLEHADQLIWVASPPKLCGMHALIGIDEVALVALPDAGHRGWTPRPAAPPDVTPPSAVPPPIDWSDFHYCDENPPAPTAVPTPPAPTPIDLLPDLNPVIAYNEDPLRKAQVALVTMCAARADQVAILSVPAHYDLTSTLTWHTRFVAEQAISDGFSSAASPLSYASFWHPWVSVAVGQNDNRAVLRDLPPDGVVAGMIAARELARGAWIAPAGVPLADVVRLASPIAAKDATRLFDAHANLITQHPGTFSALSAHTLTGDPAQLQLSVRRLLILLRKIALLLGARYTFEINNDRFRQLVRMRFDRILGALVDRGALHAYAVVIDGAINTAEDQDDGRFIVSLQIAPTSPVEFITVTLVRSGSGLLEVLEG